MSAQRLNLLDTSWVLTESRSAPNHVGGLLQFRLPPGAPKDFLRRLMTEFRSHRDFKAPWNRRLQLSSTRQPLPAWVDDADIDLEYHVRHAALPWPGGERELGELVGRLHSTPIDLSRPPWECTIIEGLTEERFALFIKMHHSLIDGVSGMKLLQRSMATEREASLGMPPFWAGGAPRAAHGGQGAKEGAKATPTLAGVAAAAVQALSSQARSVPRLAAAFGKLFARLGSRSEPGLVVPFADSPRSVLNGRVREKRRFATQQFALERLRALAKAGGGTLNDVVLALCGGALRRFLLERDALPARSLTAGIPVSVRPPDDDGTGNEITFIIATLGTDIADAGERFAAIRASVQRGKAHVQSLPRQAMAQYTVMLMAPTMALMLSGIGGRVRPMFNVTISNVPGPDKPLFFRGAELLALYPASIVTHGLALNITCHSCAGAMNFGFTGCHSSVPSLQRLAVYLAQALEELEAALATPARQPAQPKPKVRKVAAPATPARPARATRATRATRAAKATKAASPTRRRQAAAAPPARPKKPRASAATRSAAG